MKATTGNQNRPEPAGLWSLPGIVNVEVKKAHYDPPKQFWVNQQILEVRDGLELLVQFTGPLPVQAYSPALYIGDTAIVDYKSVGHNAYRFFVIDPTILQPGAPISLGWPQLPRQELVTSNFRFQMR
jgi:hypothetical protein